MATILVAIAAYNESHLAQTVKSILDNRSGEHDVRVNVCEFRTDSEFSKLQDEFVVHMKNETSVPTGVGISRYMALVNAHCFDYVLQCDAHMLFSKNWDEEIISRYKAISNNYGEKIVISQHVSPCMEGEDGTMVPIAKNDESSLLFINENFHVWSNNWVQQKTMDWRENSAVSAAYMFSESKTFIEVPPDPHMWFYGEELSTYLRLISRGIKSFSTDYVDIYHLDKGEKTFNAARAKDWRTVFSNDIHIPVIMAMDRYTLQRVSSIFDGTITGLWGAPTKELAAEAIKIMNIDVEKFKKMYQCL